MKKCLVMFFVLLVAATTVSAKEFEVSKKAGDYDVKVTIDSNPPVVGTNTITVTVKDADGTAVTDAKVSIDYSMPPMPGMPPMNYKTDAAPEKGKYVASLNLSMGGSWNIAVNVKKGDKSGKMKFTIDAR